MQIPKIHLYNTGTKIIVFVTAVVDLYKPCRICVKRCRHLLNTGSEFKFYMWLFISLPAEASFNYKTR